MRPDTEPAAAPIAPHVIPPGIANRSMITKFQLWAYLPTGRSRPSDVAALAPQGEWAFACPLMAASVTKASAEGRMSGTPNRPSDVPTIAPAAMIAVVATKGRGTARDD